MASNSHLPQDYFVVANEVRVVAPESAHHGRTGEISMHDADADEDDPPYQVTFNRDLGDAAWFYPDEIEMME